MQQTSSTQPALPSAWADVLEKVQNTLERAESEAGEREQALFINAQPPETDAEFEATRQRQLHQLEERLHRLQAVLQQADQEASGADAVLASDAEMFSHWHAAAAALRPRLADGTGRAIR